MNTFRIILPYLILLPALVSWPIPGAGQDEDTEVTTYQFTKVVRYDMQVVRVAGQGLTVDIDGFGRRRFQVPHDFTFDIDGDIRSLHQLRPGQRLRAYVTEIETGELVLVQDEESAEVAVGETVED